MPESDDLNPTPWNREYGDEVDAVGMRLLEAYAARIEDAIQKISSDYMVVEDRSSLSLDDRYLGAWRGGGIAVGAVQASVDALRTLRGIVLELHVIPMTASYPLLRAAIENASAAIYLIGPPERDQRLRHTYWVADEDARLRQSYEAERGSNGAAEKRTEVREEIRRLVRTRGSFGDPAAFSFPRVTYSDQIEFAAAVLAADPAATIESEMTLLAMWQVLSGLSHGKQWAMIEILERSGAIVDVTQASAHVRMTSSPAVIAWFMERAIQTVECALRLYGRRSKAAWAEAEDASEPTLSRRRNSPTIPRDRASS